MATPEQIKPIIGGFGHQYGKSTAKAMNDYRYAIGLMNYQNDLNIENWQRQNAYDSPEAQMQRYRNAGLNPNLVYDKMMDSGAISSPGAQSVQYEDQSVERATAVMETLNHITGSVMQADINKYQKDNLASQTELAKSSVIKNLAEARNIEGLAPYQKNLIDKQITDIEKSWSYKEKDQQLQGQNLDLQYEMLMTRKAEISDQMKNNAVNRDKAKQEISEIQSRVEKLAYEKTILSLETEGYKLDAVEKSATRKMFTDEEWTPEEYAAMKRMAAKEALNVGGKVAETIKEFGLLNNKLKRLGY